MTGRLAGILALAAAVALTSLAGTSLRAVSAQERDEGERVEQERERVERWRAERRPMAEHARALALMAPFRGARLGVRIEDVDADAVNRLGLPEERGARVDEVLEETPAATAGLREDDVIVRWNDQRVESVAQLRRLVAETPAGRTVRLGVIRGGSERTMELELAEWEAPRVRIRGPEFDHEGFRERLRDAERRMDRTRVMMVAPRVRLGVGLQSLTPQLAEYFGVEGGGALVTSVREGTPAERAGLRAGDVVTRIGDQAVEGPGDVMRALREREAGPVELRVVRDRQERTLTVELEERERGEGTSFHYAPDGTFELGPFHIEGFRMEPLELEFEAIELPELGIERIEIPALEIPAIEFRGLDLPAIEVPIPVAPRAPAERIVQVGPGGGASPVA